MIRDLDKICKEKLHHSPRSNTPFFISEQCRCTEITSPSSHKFDEMATHCLSVHAFANLNLTELVAKLKLDSVEKMLPMKTSLDDFIANIPKRPGCEKSSGPKSAPGKRLRQPKSNVTVSKCGPNGMEYTDQTKSACHRSCENGNTMLPFTEEDCIDIVCDTDIGEWNHRPISGVRAKVQYRKSRIRRMGIGRLIAWI